MKRAACFLIALLFLITITAIVRCDETIINAQLLLDDNQPSKTYYGNLYKGETITITLDVTQGSADFHLLGAGDTQLLDKTNIGTEGYQGQYNVQNDGEYEFVTERPGTGSTIVQITVTTTGTTGDGTQNNGGGIDPAPIVAAAVIIIILLIAVFLIIRMRKQSPPPPPPPPPP